MTCTKAFHFVKNYLFDVEIISKRLGLVADTASILPGLRGYSSFICGKTVKQATWWQMRREDKLLVLTVCRITESCKDSGFKDLTLQDYSVEVETSNK